MADERGDAEFEDEADGQVDRNIDIDAIDTTNPDIIGTARRRYGGPGAILGAGMFGLDVALGNKKKPDSVQIQEAPSEPIDVDKSGIQVIIDDLTSVAAPALERREPVGLNKKKARHRER